MVSTLVFLLLGHCNGIPTTNFGCCTSSNPCDVGEGDCNLDSECAGRLICGSDNCRTKYSTPGSNWGSFADCCTDGK